MSMQVKKRERLFQMEREREKIEREREGREEEMDMREHDTKGPLNLHANSDWKRNRVDRMNVQILVRETKTLVE